MDEAQTKQMLKKWWSHTKRLRGPEATKRLQEAMGQARASLFSDFVTRKNGAELVDTLRNLLAMTYSSAHYAGMRRGYLTACRLYKLESGKADHRAKSAIASLIEKHPAWTTKEIFAALDEKEKVPFYRLKAVPKHVTRWSDVASEPTYKMFVTRIRQKVRAVSPLTGWQELMREHEGLRRKVPSTQG
jgi:hypothetical protein